MTSVTLRGFLETKLQENEEKIEDIEALTIEGKSCLDEIRLLLHSEEINRILNEKYSELSDIPRFVIWTSKRIYFLTTHHMGPAYDGDDCQYEYDVSSISRNPSAELIQSKY